MMIMIKKKNMKKAIAVGVGYKNWNGKKFTKRYEYELYTQRDVEIVKAAGGEVRAITN